MSKLYTDEFKLSVVLDYYNSPLGVRAIATKYNLPSKNYIGDWEKSLKKKGCLPEDAAKPNKAIGRSKESVMREDARTPREKQYEEEIQALKARIAYFEGLDYMQPFIKKRKHPESQIQSNQPAAAGVPCRPLVQDRRSQRIGLLQIQKESTKGRHRDRRSDC
jgi:transposase-like protein